MRWGAVRRITAILVAAPALLLSQLSFADVSGELHDLYRGARAQAMGNAFVAVADDEEAIFYNPAGLAGQGARFNYFALDSEISSDSLTTVRSDLKTFSSLNSSTLTALMGKDIYARAALSSTYVANGFGIGLLSDQQLAILVENRALPATTLGYQTTNGIQLSYGFKVSQNGGRASKHSPSELRFGFGFKALFRRGGYRDLTLPQLLNISEDSFRNLIGDFGHGFGGDLGMQYIRHLNNRVSLMAGASYTEIGDVKFVGGSPDPQVGDLSVGVASRYEMGGLKATVAYDVKHLNVSTDWRMRQHIGAELAVPLFAVDVGLSELSPTYGFSVDVWLAKVTFTSYAEELGAIMGINTERRYLLRIAFGI